MNYLRSMEIVIPQDLPKWKAESYPYNLPMLKANFKLEFKEPITFILGENGSGKSTLLENLAGAIGFNPLGGNKNHIYNGVGIEDKLPFIDNMKLVWNLKAPWGFFLRAESFLNFAGYLEDMSKDPYVGSRAFSSFGYESLQKKSHGESFFAFFENITPGIYILDEPEAALSPERQMGLISIIDRLVKKGGYQFIISTHSPLLVASPNSEIYEIKDQKLELTEFKQTKQFMLYKAFLNSPEKYIKYLCE